MKTFEIILIRITIFLAIIGIVILMPHIFTNIQTPEHLYTAEKPEIIEVIKINSEQSNTSIRVFDTKTTPLPVKSETSAPPQPILLPEAVIYNQGLTSTVNILCEKNQREYIVATGAIVHSSGYILSNAHVAEGVPEHTECTIRRGSPAVAFATAHLIYIPEVYTATTSEETRARSDFSLWKINEPGDYPFWNIEYDQKFTNHETLLTLSYPAELLGNDIILKALNLVFSKTSVEATDSIIVRSSSNISAQHGSSGGILVDPYTSRVRSMIFAVGENTTISQRELYSLTPKSINIVLQKEIGKTLIEYLAELPL